MGCKQLESSPLKETCLCFCTCHEFSEWTLSLFPLWGDSRNAHPGKLGWGWGSHGCAQEVSSLKENLQPRPAVCDGALHVFKEVLLLFCCLLFTATRTTCFFTNCCTLRYCALPKWSKLVIEKPVCLTLRILIKIDHRNLLKFLIWQDGHVAPAFC